MINIPPGDPKKLICSHKAPIVSIQWVPNQFEVDKRGVHHTGPNKSKNGS